MKAIFYVQPDTQRKEIYIPPEPEKGRINGIIINQSGEIINTGVSFPLGSKYYKIQKEINIDDHIVERIWNFTIERRYLQHKIIDILYQIVEKIENEVNNNVIK